MTLQPGDLIYLRYIGNIRHWSREVFQAPVTWVGATHFAVAVEGQAIRFERRSLRHDNRGHPPAYQLFLSRAVYEQEAEATELRNLMSRTDFVGLSVDKQRAIRVILEG